MKAGRASGGSAASPPPVAVGPFGGRLELHAVPLCPEISLWLLDSAVDLEARCEALAEGEAPPFWAFCWGSGQALARHVLDHPALVRGRRVVDVGAGSGVVAIAAARAGAAAVTAVDVDVQALAIQPHNARANGVVLAPSAELPADAEVVLAADVMYEPVLRERLLGLAAEGRRVIVADPERTGTPPVPGRERGRYEVRTFPDADTPQRGAVIVELPSASSSA